MESWAELSEAGVLVQLLLPPAQGLLTSGSTLWDCPLLTTESGLDGFSGPCLSESGLPGPGGEEERMDGGLGPPSVLRRWHLLVLRSSGPGSQIWGEVVSRVLRVSCADPAMGDCLPWSGP